MRWCFALLLLMASTARAEDPWAAGVSEQQKTAAEAELARGNERFVEKDYTGALAHYRTAIASWDHPAIRFNVVRCLIQLDRPIEASDELAKALKYGAAPLEEQVYREALSYQKLLAAQVGELTVSCTRPGVALTLDAKRLGTCPLTRTERMTPGPHQIVGELAGYLTKKVEVDVIGGKTVTQAIELAPLAQAAHVEHRFPLWLPWTVFGGGLAVAGIGGLLELNASGQLDSYDDTIAGQCADDGCPMSTALGERRRALRLNKVAIGVMTVGAAATVAGAVLLVMNRGTTVYEQQRAVTVVPAPGGAVAAIVGTW